MAQTINSILKYPEINDHELQISINHATNIIKRNLPDFTEHFQSNTSSNNFF